MVPMYNSADTESVCERRDDTAIDKRMRNDYDRIIAAAND